MQDRQDVHNRDIRDLWARGKFWEVFGFSSGDFTTLELAKQYSLLTKAHHESPETIQIIDETFATLNAPLMRQFYEGCRMLMRRISGQIGSATYRDAEHRIWRELWSWVSKSWEEPPEELIKALVKMYRLPDGTEAIRLPQSWSDEGLKPADMVESVKYCPSCGKSGVAGMSFCQQCGQQLTGLHPEKRQTPVSRAEATIGENSWFERHLNWTGILIGLAIPLLGVGVYILASDLLIRGGAPAIVFVLGIALFAATVWAIFWLLKKKQRSWSWSLLVFVPYIGWFVFIAVYLTLKNRSQTL